VAIAVACRGLRGRMGSVSCFSIFFLIGALFRMLVKCFAVWRLMNPDNLLWSKFRRYEMSKGNCEVQVSASPFRRLPPASPTDCICFAPFSRYSLNFMIFTYCAFPNSPIQSSSSLLLVFSVEHTALKFQILWILEHSDTVRSTSLQPWHKCRAKYVT
jgi:hypothetical protein